MPDEIEVTVEIEPDPVEESPTVVVVETGGSDDGSTDRDIDFATRLTRVEDAIIVMGGRLDTVETTAVVADSVASAAITLATDALEVAETEPEPEPEPEPAPKSDDAPRSKKHRFWQ
jgi:hypothetical protein